MNTPVVTIIWFVLLIGIFWFLVLRPQRQEQKKREEMIRALRRGDRVVTMGGMHGTITEMADDTVQMRIADKVEITVSRSSVGQVLAGKDKSVAGPRARTPKASDPVGQALAEDEQTEETSEQK